MDGSYFLSKLIWYVKYSAFYLSHFTACHSRAIALGVHAHSVELLCPELLSSAGIMSFDTPRRDGENGKAVCVFKKKIMVDPGVFATVILCPEFCTI